MQRLLRRTMTMIVMACMILVMAAPAFAGETASIDGTKTENAEVLADDNGVVQVLYVYTNDSGDSYAIGYGTGFFINETNIITCNHVVSLDSDMEEEATETLGISVKQLRERLSVKISVYRDSTPLEAEIVSQSPIMDYAILQLKQPMSNKTPLKIRHSSTVKKTEAVYTIGFPGVVESLKVINGGTGDDSSINRGEVVSTDNVVIEGESIECIVSDNVVSSGNSGGPLVDNSGNVVGICKGVLDNKYAYSVQIDQVLKDLDARGVKYTLITDPDPAPQPKTEPAPIEEVTDDTSAGSEAPGYTSSSGDDGNTIDPGDKNDGTDSAEHSGLPISKTMLLIIIVVAAVVVVIIILLLMTSKKKKQAAVGSIPTQGGAAPGQLSGQAGGFGGTPAGGFTPGNKAPGGTTYGGSPETEVLGNAGETTLLGQGSNETTVLNHNKNYGKLTRKKTGESVTINRDSFKIGKERSKVDYCVSDNTAVSRLHAIIIHRNGSAFIVDQNSKNFTLVNDVRATANVEVPIKNGDKITIADEEYTYNAN